MVGQCTEGAAARHRSLARAGGQRVWGASSVAGLVCVILWLGVPLKNRGW